MGHLILHYLLIKNDRFPPDNPSRTPPFPLIILAIVIIFLHFILRSNFITILILKKCPKCIILSLNFILNSILNSLTTKIDFLKKKVKCKYAFKRYRYKFIGGN